MLNRCRKCNRQAPIGNRLCAKCLKTKLFKVTTGPACTRGRNARGVCLHKADKPRTKHQSTNGPKPPPGFKDPFKKGTR